MSVLQSLLHKSGMFVHLFPVVLEYLSIFIIIYREKRWLQEQKDVNEALRQKIDALGDGAGGNITKQRY